MTWYMYELWLPADAFRGAGAGSCELRWHAGVSQQSTVAISSSHHQQNRAGTIYFERQLRRMIDLVGPQTTSSRQLQDAANKIYPRGFFKPHGSAGYDTYLSRCHSPRKSINRSPMFGCNGSCYVFVLVYMSYSVLFYLVLSKSQRSRLKIQYSRVVYSLKKYTTVPRDSRYTVNIRTRGGPTYYTFCVNMSG
eukprot:SAG25_NODE_1582_length_2729_cov_2.836184_4_plen_193_part_00